MQEYFTWLIASSDFSHLLIYVAFVNSLDEDQERSGSKPFDTLKVCLKDLF